MLLLLLFNLQKQFEQQIEMQTTLEEIGREVCLCDVHVMCMWCACGVHVVCMWCACDVHVVCM